MKPENKKQGINKGMIVAMIFIPILVAIGVVAGYYFTSAEQNPDETVQAEEKEEITVPLEEFLVNMNSDAGRIRYVRLEMSLSSHEENIQEVIDVNLAKVRDAVIYTLYTQSSESVFEEKEGSFTLKNELKNRINETLGDELVHEVYITNIVMQ